MWTSTPTPQYDDVDPSSDADRGPGWDTVIDASTGPVEVEKGGQVPGYTSELVLFPNTDSGVFVSYNSLNPHGVGGLQCRRTRCTRRHELIQAHLQTPVTRTASEGQAELEGFERDGGS